MWRQFRKQWLGAMIIAPTVAIAVASLSWTGVMQWIEWATLDQIMRLRPQEPIDERITLITIDEQDIKFVRQWPLSDQLLAQSIYNLAAHEPRAIGIDLYRESSIEPGKEALTRAFQENTNVIGIERLYERVIPPTPVLDELGQVAAADLIQDRDGKVRRAFLRLEQQSGLAVKLADLYLKEEQSEGISQIFSEIAQDSTVGQTTFYPLKVDDRGYAAKGRLLEGYQILINYRGGLDKFNQISLQNVLENQFPRELVRDKIILMGTIEPSQGSFLTPYSSRFLKSLQVTPGVVIHANLTSQLLGSVIEGRELFRTIKSKELYLMIFVVSAIGAVSTKLFLQSIPSIFREIIITFISTCSLFSLALLGMLNGLIMPIFTPCLTLITSMIVTASYESQRQLKSINQELECANQRLASYSKDLEGEVGDRTEELSSALNDLQTTQINLIQAEKMAALGQMVAGIAHELNNPISYISGNVEHAKAYSEELLVVIDVFRERYQDAETDALLEDLDLEYVRSDFAKLLASIDKGTQRITDIVQSLRTFSRLDEAELKQINLSNDLSSVLLLTKSRIENRPDNLEIDLSTQFDELPAVQCYAAQINQVFLNLLENAIDAIEVSFAENNLSNGKIVVEGKTLETEHIQISITDNGVGIPENLQTKIFDPFFTTKPIGQGTGLGLAIAHSVVVEQHQGSLSCETTPDGKTTFTLVLPITHRFYHTGKAATQ